MECLDRITMNIALVSIMLTIAHTLLGPRELFACM